MQGLLDCIRSSVSLIFSAADVVVVGVIFCSLATLAAQTAAAQHR
jgi:hypothetical protein